MLAYWCGQDKVVVALPSLGRNAMHLQSTVGCFINMLPICSSIDCTWSGVQLVNAARDSMRQAQANSDTPFLEIMRGVNPARDASITPIFQATIAPAESDMAAEESFGVPQEPLPINTVGSQVFLPGLAVVACTRSAFDLARPQPWFCGFCNLLKPPQDCRL